MAGRNKDIQDLKPRRQRLSTVEKPFAPRTLFLTNSNMLVSRKLFCGIQCNHCHNRHLFACRRFMFDQFVRSINFTWFVQNTTIRRISLSTMYSNFSSVSWQFPNIFWIYMRRCNAVSADMHFVGNLTTTKFKLNFVAFEDIWTS